MTSNTSLGLDFWLELPCLLCFDGAVMVVESLVGPESIIYPALKLLWFVFPGVTAEPIALFFLAVNFA